MLNWNADFHSSLLSSPNSIATSSKVAKKVDSPMMFNKLRTNHTWPMIVAALVAEMQQWVLTILSFCQELKGFSCGWGIYFTNYNRKIHVSSVSSQKKNNDYYWWFGFFTYVVRKFQKSLVESYEIIEERKELNVANDRHVKNSSLKMYFYQSICIVKG